MTPQVNLIGTKNPTGEPVFEVIQSIEPETELLASLIPDTCQEMMLLPASRDTILLPKKLFSMK